VPACGVPLSRPVDELNVTPAGKVPISLKVGVGNPLAVTVKVPLLPTLKVAALLLVIVGASLTVRTKLWFALGLTPFVAVKVKSYVPPAPAKGVPLKTPVDELNEMPFGNVPVSASVGAGDPFAVTIKYEFIPTVNVALSALVIVGAMFRFFCPLPYDCC